MYVRLAIDDSWCRKPKSWTTKSKIMQNMQTGFQCAGCGEWNSTAVDESAGREQSYVEDCQVCCKPNVLHVGYDPAAQEFFVTAELE